MSINMTDHQLLVQSILKGKLNPDEKIQSFAYIETHISSVILGHDRVYKLKKPLDLGFLDFSTLEKRRYYCEEEIRLNRRLSPQLYLGVLAVYGTVENPSLIAQGEPIEYLVHMKPFPQSAQLDRLLHKGLLSRDIIIDFANYIADFHQCAQHADSNSEYGTLESISLPVDENFKQIKALLKDDRIQQQVDQLEEWSKSEFIRIQSHLLQRKLDGFIRECHGDLHLRNLAWMDGQALAFDCIEFDPKLYWIDVISDLAFLWMDLLLNRREDLAWALLNQYLSRTGDYAALALLRFYSVYRALVRAKIAAITLAQSAQSEVQQDLVNHLDLAQSLSQSQQPTIFLMHGPSGSGKSTLSQQLVAPLRAVILRSDVERKRLYHLRANHDAASVPEQGIYTSEATRHTYQYLLDMARLITAAGYSVIVDATFNQRHQRALFTEFARTMGYPCRILDLKVSESNLRQRILQRENDVSDADLQVLEHQLKGWQALSDDEQPFVLAIDLNDAIDLQEIVAVIQRSGLQL